MFCILCFQYSLTQSDILSVKIYLYNISLKPGIILLYHRREIHSWMRLAQMTNMKSLNLNETFSAYNWTSAESRLSAFSVSGNALIKSTRRKWRRDSCTMTSVCFLPGKKKRLDRAPCFHWDVYFIMSAAASAAETKKNDFTAHLPSPKMHFTRLFLTLLVIMGVFFVVF